MSTPRRRLAGAERVSHVALNIHCEQMRATHPAPRGPSNLPERTSRPRVAGFAQLQMTLSNPSRQGSFLGSSSAHSSPLAPRSCQRGVGYPTRLSTSFGSQRCGARTAARPQKMGHFSTAPHGGARGAVRRGDAAVARLRRRRARRVPLLHRYGSEGVGVTARRWRVASRPSEDFDLPWPCTSRAEGGVGIPSALGLSPVQRK